MVSPHVRSAMDDEGLVLLDLRTGRYLTFNAVGAVLWSKIEAGVSRAAIIRQLQQQFDAPAELIRVDVDRILAQLARDHLIVPGMRRPPAGPAPRDEGERPGGSGAGERIPSRGDVDPRELSAAAAEGHDAGGGSVFWIVIGFLTLVYMDFLMKVLRFPRLYSVLGRCRTACRRAEPTTLEVICRSVDRAAAGYFKQAWCLQRSAACAYLLRRQGCPAQLVLGVRTFPFEAHAWVEVAGRVINDRPHYIQGFLPLDRV